MDEKTLNALENSIKHWEYLHNTIPSDDSTEKVNGKYCSLCILFLFGKSKENQCVGCPVYEKTEQKYCHETPFYDARDAWEDYIELSRKHEDDSPQLTDALSEWKIKSAKELDYLKSLAP
jgi:hypothetical protein